MEDEQRIRREKRNEEKTSQDRDNKTSKYESRSRRGSIEKEERKSYSSERGEKDYKTLDHDYKSKETKLKSSTLDRDTSRSSVNQEKKLENDKNDSFARYKSEKANLLKAKEERENEVLRKTEERIRQIKSTISELDRELEMLEYEKKKIKPRNNKISSDI